MCLTCLRRYGRRDLTHCSRDGTLLLEVDDGAQDIPEALVGQSIEGRFKLVEVLGRGGMSAVFRAQQSSVGRDVAVKVLMGAGDMELVQRFLREARTTSNLRSIHTVTTFDFGRTEHDLLYLAMELLEGEDLETRLEAQRRLAWPAALRIVSQVGESLSEAHGKGIVHRDLKPGNVFLTTMGADRSFVKVLDFGIAKGAHKTDVRLTDEGRVLGTPMYMSPEQARAKEIDGRSDIYSLGVILYHMLSGRAPFMFDSPVTTMVAHCTEPIPPLTVVAPGVDVPPEVEQLMMGMLEKDRDKRVRTASEVTMRALQLCAAGSEVESTTVPELASVEQVIGTASRWPTEVRVGAVGREGLVGRDFELETLLQAARRVRILDQLELVPVIGPSGSGKTLLTSAFNRALAQLEGAYRWDAARCSKSELPPAYEPFTAILRARLELTDDVSPSETAVRVSAMSKVIARDIPVRDALRRVDSLNRLLGFDHTLADARPATAAERSHAFELFVDYLKNATSEHPTILCIDDLHWATEPTLELLAFVLEQARDLPLLVVVTLETESAEVVLRRLDPPPSRTHALTLPPFGYRETELLVRDRLGDAELPDGLVTALFEAADGLPVAIVEACQTLLREETPDGHLITSEWGQVQAGGDLGLGPQERRKRRMDELAPRQREILDAAAVAGRACNVPLLSAMLHREVAEGEVDALIEAGLLVEIGGRILGSGGVGGAGEGRQFAVRQVELMEALRESLHVATLRALHYRAARWMESRESAWPPGYTAMLAEHYMAASCPAEAAPYLHRSAREALRAYSNREAFTSYGRALAAATAWYQDAQGDHDAYELFVAVCLERAKCGLSLGEYEPARAAADLAMRAIERAEGPEALPGAQLLMVRAEIEEALESDEAALESFGAAARIANQHGAEALAGHGMARMARLLLRGGNADDAALLCEMGEERLSEELGGREQRMGLAVTSEVKGELATRAGDLDRAVHEFGESEKHYAAAGQLAAAAAMEERVEVVQLMAQAPDAPALERARQLAEENGFDLGRVLVDKARAELLELEGRHGPALRLIEQVIPELKRLADERDLARAVALSARSRAALGKGDVVDSLRRALAFAESVALDDVAERLRELLTRAGRSGAARRRWLDDLNDARRRGD